jgi:hypothetical protein
MSILLGSDVLLVIGLESASTSFEKLIDYHVVGYIIKL